MENWRDYVGVQSIEGTKDAMVFYMTQIVDDNGQIRVTILNSLVPRTEICLSLTEMTSQLEKELSSFPQVTVTSPAQLEEEKLKISNFYGRRNDGPLKDFAPSRIVANTNWNNSWFYTNNTFDTSIIVVESGDKYAIFKNPNFNYYGFTIRKSEETQ